MGADETVGVTAPYTAEVCDRHGHSGSRDAMCSSALEVHGQVRNGHVVYEGLCEAHLEPLGGPFAVFGATHADLAQVGAVEGGIQYVGAAAVSVCGVAHLLVVAQASSV